MTPKLALNTNQKSPHFRFWKEGKETKMKTLKLLGTSALTMALAVPALASGPEINDAFSVVFNGRAELSINYSTDFGLDDAINGGTSDELFMEQEYTRFGFTGTGSTAVGDFKARIEADFNGAGNTLRIRHAYGSVGPILAGQTDSVMRTGMPYVSDWGWNRVDAVSAGNNYFRTQQLRYTSKLGGAKFIVAVEDNGAGGNDFFDITGSLGFDFNGNAVTVKGILKPSGDSAISAATSFSLGSGDAFVTAHYADGTTVNGFNYQRVISGTGQSSFGIGAGAYFPAGDHLTAYVGGAVTEGEGTNINEQTYLTASLT